MNIFKVKNTKQGPENAVLTVPIPHCTGSPRQDDANSQSKLWKCERNKQNYPFSISNCLH